MAKPRTETHSWREALSSALLVAAFLSSGAWMVIRLPPIPVSKSLNLATAGVWLVVFGLGWVRLRRPHRRVLWGLAGIGVAVGASYLAAGSLAAVAVYDLFADMPLVQWLALLAVFVLSAGMVARRRSIEAGLAVIVAVGVVLVSVIAALQAYTNAYGTFGSSAYSTTALAPLIPVAAALGAARVGWKRNACYAAAGYIAVVLAFFAGSTMGMVASAFAVLVTITIHPAVSRATALPARAVRWAGLGLAGLMVAGLVFAQIPALSGQWVNAETLGRFDKNIVTRAYLWEGAQAMVSSRLVLGFGPSGYRLHAAEYLAPQTFQFGSDFQGSIDPTIYSPQSPHSVVWEIATRLGLLGLAAFGLLLGLWGSVVVAGFARGSDSAGADLRLALAAAFVVALFALLVNPMLFAVGLFPAAAAGLAVNAGDGAQEGSAPDGQSTRWFRIGSLVLGATIVALAVWLGIGESRALAAVAQPPAGAIAAYERALQVLPGHPMTARRLLESRLLAAPDETAVRGAQSAVDASPGYMGAYAPNLVNFAAYSLTQADQTGRTDVAWEQGLLDRAGAVLPPLPSLVAERLHAAVIAGDVAAIEAALPDARTWGGPYPYTETYIQRATAVLSGTQ